MKKLFFAISTMLFAACAPKYPTVTPEQLIEAARIIQPKVLFPKYPNTTQAGNQPKC